MTKRLDPEIKSMRAIHCALANLGHEARQRVTVYFFSRETADSCGCGRSVWDIPRKPPPAGPGQEPADG